MSIIHIEKNVGIPKYKQIVTSIENAIALKQIKLGDKLPSINSIRTKYKLSRDTILYAYNDLKVRGIIESIPGKGYYVNSESVYITQKVFLLFDELNAFKEDLYNSFLTNLNETIEVDIFFHHFNYDVFKKLIYDNLGKYNYYIIMPAKLEKTELILNKISQKKVYILDQTNSELSHYPAIYQNFEKDIFNGLLDGLKLLKKYDHLVFLFEEDKQPNGLLKGFKKFCSMNRFKNTVIESLEGFEIEKGDVFIIPDDRNLIRIIKKVKETKFKIASDIGIISYNDTLLKEIVEDGITTISTDFKAMGKKLAQMISNNEEGQIENENKLIIRNSL
ncbi:MULTISPECIES: GntR family transcriptional regulator [unclassified Tenacibaculum]|uniref:GntR family transcriptional regulator n=1 Tax=unclassified Tenacibaculum TaxID=2635139 RepID=UPI001F444690|nr:MULTISPECIES: GntR family transcriptional regulator [unclassified Tenacibaculum]MCF2873622.1 GntR family transcriptional regulator [Tenacibaculum sp. Cn5-1]MCF2933778.1 GntR family transcriptional regulator [Tenacibaculum sp. Cn5-34]MCG7509640.1 GntR family transcriptional regulator [Tenacibaculum sp. Cn5-46]